MRCDAILVSIVDSEDEGAWTIRYVVLWGRARGTC
jgi:hypothetical protein